MMQALYDQDQQLRGFVKILRDNTNRKRTEDALQQLNDSLEQQVEERTRQIRHLVNKLTLSEQTERRRVSQILHDDLQQRLYGLQYQIAFLNDALNSKDDNEARSIITKTNQELKNTIEIVRSLSVNLSPPILEGEGLVEAIEWLATQMRQQYAFVVHVQVVNDLPTLEDDLLILFFQIVRELLFNVVKHAGVAEAVVTISETDNQLRIEVSDQGKGFDVDATWTESGDGTGLWRNQKRLELIGGQMEIESSSSRGTHIVITCGFSKSGNNDAAA